MIYMNDGLTGRFKEEARSMGFNMVGIVAARPGRRLSAYINWLANNYHGEMGYMARPDRMARREDPNVILEGINSIICVGLDYGGIAIPEKIALDPGRGRISNYAWSADYHQVMAPRLEELSRWLADECGHKTESKVYVDTGALLERDHAEQGGLGFTGKNTMLIGPRSGSYFFLGELLTTAELEPDVPRTMPGCGSCTQCLAACPTKAFPRPYVLDARRCISYLTIELRGWIPVELRPMMGNWVYGCDICQEVCPFNRFAIPSRETAFWPETWDSAAPPLPDLLSLTEEGFRERFTSSPIKRIKRQGLVRNACVAAGNWGSQEVADSLAQLLADPEPLIRGHAAWALGQISGRRAADALKTALVVEEDQQVRNEMLAALFSLERR